MDDDSNQLVFRAVRTGLSAASCVVLASAMHFALFFPRQEPSLKRTSYSESLCVPFSQSRWLILSSFSFLVPALVAFLFDPSQCARLIDNPVSF